jgi:phosphoglycolate phosphatase
VADAVAGGSNLLVVGRPIVEATDPHAATLRILEEIDRANQSSPAPAPHDKHTHAPCQHVVWDWNGTLLDDTWLCIDIMNELLAERNLPALTLTRYHEVFDFPVEDCITGGSALILRAIPSPWWARSSSAATKSAGLKPAFTRAARTTLELHPRISPSPSPSCPLTATTPWKNCWPTSKCAPFFAGVLGSDNVYARGKIEQGRRWIGERGVDPATVLLIGDTIHDFEVASAMRCRCLLVADGYHPRARLEPLGAPVVSDLHDVPAWFESRELAQPVY